MDWDTYKEKIYPLAQKFGELVRRREIDCLMKGQSPDTDAMAQSLHDMVDEIITAQNNLDSALENPESMHMVIADVLGIKGDKRDKLLETARGIEVKRPDGPIISGNPFS